MEMLPLGDSAHMTLLVCYASRMWLGICSRSYEKDQRILTHFIESISTTLCWGYQLAIQELASTHTLYIMNVRLINKIGDGCMVYITI
jgi:hypothetical protein